MSNPITKFTISPSYYNGFVYSWEIDPLFLDKSPWRFVVEQGPTNNGPWAAISPVIQGAYSWSDSLRRFLSKDEVLNFRIVMTTPTGRYESNVISPYADLNKREWCLAAEIMRTEVQQARQLAGIEGLLLVRAIFGPKCTNCTDVVTGAVLSSHCNLCYGVGKVPGYHGPYKSWMVFTPTPQQNIIEGDNTANRQVYDSNVRVVGQPPIKKNDILVDPRSDKRYRVETVSQLAMIKQFALVQALNVSELPTSEPAYKVKVT